MNQEDPKAMGSFLSKMKWYMHTCTCNCTVESCDRNFCVYPDLNEAGLVCNVITRFKALYQYGSSVSTITFTVTMLCGGVGGTEHVLYMYYE